MKHCFVRPEGPLGPFAEDYRAYLFAAGYGFGAVQHRNSELAEISRWLESERLAASEFGEVQAGRFIAARRARGLVTFTSPASVRLPLAFLRSVGAVPAACEPGGVFDVLLAAYRVYLFNERGLVDKTVAGHLVVAGRFCVGVGGGSGGLAGLGAGDVTGYEVFLTQRDSCWVDSDSSWGLLAGCCW